MKITGYSLKQLFLYLLLSIVVTHSVHSQGTAADLARNTDDRRTSLSDALKALEARHNAFIIYNLKAVENRDGVTYNTSRASAGIEESLKNLLEPIGLHYERINEKVYVIVMPEEAYSNVSAMSKADVGKIEDEKFALSSLTFAEHSTLKTFMIENSKTTTTDIALRKT